MLRRRHSESCIGSEALIADEGLVIVRKEEATSLGLEAFSPLEGPAAVPTPRVGVKVVDDVAASNDEIALVAEWRQPLPQLIVE